MSIAEKLLEELRQREDLRDALAQELMPAIFRKLRLAVLSALYREVATKSDLAELRNEFRREIYSLRREIDILRHEIEDLRREVRDVRREVGELFVRLFVAFNIPILIALIGILLKLVFVP